MSIDRVERLEQQRDDYLVALYELSDGDVTKWPTHLDIAQRIELSVDESMRIGMQLSQQHLCEYKTMAGPHGSVAITPLGVRRAEDIIRRRESAGEALYSTLAILSDAELRQILEPLLTQLRQSIDQSSDVDPDVRADAAADLDSMQDQLRATRPNRGVVRAALERIKANWVSLVLGAATLGSAITDIVRRLGH